MTTKLINARMVLPDRIDGDGSLLHEDGLVVSVGPECGARADRIHDCQGHWLLPGFVDLHCDVIERDVEVRPDVNVPMELSIREADRRNAACGITTQFHGISFGHAERGLRDDARAAELAKTIRAAASSLLVDNRVLLRYELSSESAQRVVLDLMACACCDLLSFMDHGKDSGTYRTILEAWRGGSAAGRSALERMRELAREGKLQGISMGSHDDDSVERLHLLHDLGVGISEFPKTMEIAREAVKLGFHTVVGGVNAVRGGSHLKWMSASDAVRAGLAGAICSDYHPTILPHAIFGLYREGAASLPEIVRCVSSSPAQAAGLFDRGALEAGRRADLVEIAVDRSGWARVVNCWSRGRLVSSFPDTGRVARAEPLKGNAKR